MNSQLILLSNKYPLCSFFYLSFLLLKYHHNYHSLNYPELIYTKFLQVCLLFLIWDFLAVNNIIPFWLWVIHLFSFLRNIYHHSYINFFLLWLFYIYWNTHLIFFAFDFFFIIIISIGYIQYQFDFFCYM